MMDCLGRFLDTFPENPVQLMHYKIGARDHRITVLMNGNTSYHPKQVASIQLWKVNDQRKMCYNGTPVRYAPLVDVRFAQYALSVNNIVLIAYVGLYHRHIFVITTKSKESPRFFVEQLSRDTVSCTANFVAYATGQNCVIECELSDNNRYQYLAAPGRSRDEYHFDWDTFLVSSAAPEVPDSPVG
jgi:hypothetical protein